MNPERWQRIKDVYQQARDRSGPERVEFVHAACAGDKDLAAEVLALLDVSEEGSAELDDIVTAASDAFEGALPSGERLGPYRLVRAIGRGGMGHVYLAERADDEFDQQVAIKTVSRLSASPSLIERFRLERQILAKLDHPHIARLLDGGRSDSGVPFLVMEFVDGRSIVDYGEDKDLSLDDRLTLFLKICDAVQYAHRQLIVHRDIKPSNILVTADGVPKLLDFGIAKLLDESGDNALTRADARILTPEYASPEQILGAPVTTATDVYGLGVLLYEFLSGCRPFDLDKATSPQIRELICHTDPVEPSKAALSAGRTGSAAGLSGDLDRIVMKALRKEPERRYESVRDLADDIRRYLAGRPISARPPSFGYRAGKFLQRNRASVAAASSALVAAVALTVFYTLQLAEERDTALLERQTADAATDFMIDLFANNEPNNAVGEDLTARQILERGAATLDERLEETPRVRARLMQTLGRVYERLGDYDAAQRFYEDAIALRRTLAEPDREELIAGIEGLAWIYYRREDWDAAVAAADEALAMREADYGQDDPSISDVLNLKGTIAYWLDDTDAALAHYHRSLELLDGDAEDVVHDRLVTMNNLAITYEHLGEHDKAERFYADSLETRLHLYGPDHPLVGTAHANLGTFFTNQGEWEKAVEHGEAALRIDRKTKGNEHADVAFDLAMLAGAYQGTGDYDQAAAAAAESARIWALTLGRHHSRYAEAKDQLASVLRLQGKYEEALPHAEESLAVMRTANGPDHTWTANALYTTAYVLYDLDRTEEAEPLAREAVRIRADKLGKGHHGYWDAEQVLARIEIKEGRRAAARKRLEALLLAIENSEFPRAEHMATTRDLLEKTGGAVGQ